MTSPLTSHYAPGLPEASRLVRTAHGRLELLRTQELLRRWLIPASRILDVGGGTGVHAAWLALDGHAVTVIDVVPEHIEAAAALPGVDAELGDARDLEAPDGSADVVLLLGPLYHLTAKAERAQALAEAKRVLRPGGLLVAGAISRYMSLLELGTDGSLGEGGEAAETALLATGDYDGHNGFVAAHFHTAPELLSDVQSAGFEDVAVYGVEGPAWTALDAAGDDAFDSLLDAALRCARLVERDPLVIHASAHLLAVGWAPTSVDSDDNTRVRHVVRHFRFDAAAQQATHVVVATFTDEAEFRHRIAEEEQALAARKVAGSASDREYISGIVLQPGERLPPRASRQQTGQ